jgi:2-polyprenyl-3-methyl-5-hydroxy-6-metoxy-1,4-benzoquinol methylase
MRPGSGTDGTDYARYLETTQTARWKRWLDVQRPYRWHVRRLGLGFVLDVGCGIGRNLAHLDGRGVGVDHNEAAVAVARRRGLDACTPAEFARSVHAQAGRFDSMLVAHVLEHLVPDEAEALVRGYLPYVKPGGRVVFITPQERGHAADATHVAFVDERALAALAAALGLEVERQYSFPLPRAAGRFFRYNEFVLVARTRHA